MGQRVSTSKKAEAERTLADISRLTEDYANISTQVSVSSAKVVLARERAASCLQKLHDTQADITAFFADPLGQGFIKKWLTLSGSYYGALLHYKHSNDDLQELERELAIKNATMLEVQQSLNAARSKHCAR